MQRHCKGISKAKRETHEYAMKIQRAADFTAGPLPQQCEGVELGELEDTFNLESYWSYWYCMVLHPSIEDGRG